MMSLMVKIKKDIVQAMKDKDTAKLSTLRLLLAKLENKKVELKLSHLVALPENVVEDVIRKNIKELDKEIASYIAVGRTTEKQEAEKDLLKSYLPREATHEEVDYALKEMFQTTKDSSLSIGHALKAIGNRLGLPFDKSYASKKIQAEKKKIR